MRRGLSMLTSNSEVALIVLLVLIMFLMIIPMPFWLVDSLIALNLSIALLLVITAVYIKQPLEISTFPSILLISVLFRLALSITTTRLILTTGSGGNIVSTFGDFVVGGNIVVGLVIFLIITIVQFVVITKGSERIAEVSARFTLDAMPGKQLSIDSDLRNGIHTIDTARNARKVLERQSQFYGAMDGATKFVKGDAIAGLVITIVNLVGGLIIGMAQLGLSFNEALLIYSQQTVGDGLVAQIPALFIAIAAGTVITRVSDEQSANLGRDIGAELIAEPRTLIVVSAVLVLFGFIPGFPSIVFGILAVSFVGAGILSQRHLRNKRNEKPLPTSDFSAIEASMKQTQPMAPLSLQVGRGLADRLDVDAMLAMFERVRKTSFASQGIWLPPIGLAASDVLPDDGYEVLLDEASRLSGRLPADCVELTDDPEFATLGNIVFEDHDDVVPERKVRLTPSGELPKLVEHGIGYRGQPEILGEALKIVVQRYSGNFVGLEETKRLLNHFGKQYPELVGNVLAAGPIHLLGTVLSKLVADGVSIRNLRAICQGYLDWVDKEKDPIILAEYVRTSLKDQLCQPYIDVNGMMAVLLFQADAETSIRNGIKETSVGSYLSLDADQASYLTSRVMQFWELVKANDASCVLVTSIDIRRYVRNALKMNNVDIPVLSYQDIALDIRIHPLGVIDLDPIASTASD